MSLDYLPVTGGPTANDYKQYDHRTHVYMKPESYIGSDKRTKRKDWLADLVQKKMVYRSIEWPQGSEKTYLEILTNASDNLGRSRRAGVDPGPIDITMNKATITITNYGLPIPVEIHPEEGVYVPQMIFGSLLSSSNYEVDRHDAGTNGIGGKATNIFSLWFQVVIHDSIRHLKYSQIWKNNMTECNEPLIEPYEGKKSSVQVSFTLDFARFGYLIPEESGGGYPEEVFALYARHAIDISFTTKSVVFFNGEKFDCSKIRDYSRWYFGEAVETGMIHYQWPEKTELIKDKDGHQRARDPSVLPLVEFMAIDTPNLGRHISFANCVMTVEGGVHVNATFKAVGEEAVKLVNEDFYKNHRSKKGNLSVRDKRAHTISIGDVKPHLSILVSVRVVNPEYTSFMKTALQYPTPKIKLTEEELGQIQEWEFITYLHAALEAKQQSSLAKTDGKLKKYIFLKRGIDANWAGGAQRSKCVLCIAEGNSGAGYIEKLIPQVQGSRDVIGVLPMKGKLLNVMDKDAFSIERNKELCELRSMLGLKEGVDYTIPANLAKLRYGIIMIMADSDVDGKHITGLIYNFFYCLYPTILEAGIIDCYRTPIIRVRHGKSVYKFFEDHEYEEWIRLNPKSVDWGHKYYKGLGSSGDPDVIDDYQDPQKTVSYLYDEKAPEALTLGFSLKRADDRKDWMSQWTGVAEECDLPRRTISWFVNNELIQYSVAHLHRAIARLMDGFTEAQRKIIYATHKIWGVEKGKKDYKPMRVIRFDSEAAGKTNYHHGDTILSDIIINIASEFTGSNNISLLSSKDGQFGCFDPETPILLWDGSIKKAREIRATDQLVGDDGRPRNISQVVGGIDEMYEVIQKDGMTYKVNSQHILTLHMPSHRDIYHDDQKDTFSLIYFDLLTQSVIEHQVAGDSFDQVIKLRASIPENNVFDLNLQTYLSFPKKYRDLFKSVRLIVPVAWPTQFTPIDPYVYGRDYLSATSEDRDRYLLNDIPNRLEVLAGYLDTSSFLLPFPHHHFRVTLAPEDPMIEILTTLIKGLGFRIKTKYVVGDLHEVRVDLLISGQLHLIPTRVSLLKATPEMTHLHLGGGITINHIGVGNYIGWYLDGNERFMLSDFTVVHNTRYKGGKDRAAPRYPDTSPEVLLPYLLTKRDRVILEYRQEEGQVIEPVCYYPVIPTVLVNGTHGIGTGWSTFVPNHNPLDIIKWLRWRLAEGSYETQPLLVPWYRGFKGTLNVIDRRDKKKKVTKVDMSKSTRIVIIDDDELESEKRRNDDSENDLGEDDERLVDSNVEDKKSKNPEGWVEDWAEEANNRQLLSMVTTGSYHVEGKKNTIIITELPIGRWPYIYRTKYLEKLLAEKKITGFRDLSADNSVYFEIYGFTGEISYKSLKLKLTKGMSNMFLLDTQNRPVRYDSAYDIIESFYQHRLIIYQKAKDHILSSITQNIELMNHKIRYIEAVVSGALLIINEPKNKIHQTLDDMGIPREIHSKSMNHHLSTESIEELRKEIMTEEDLRTITLQRTLQEMWTEDLDEFEKAYLRVYPEDKEAK
jgi:DNA gyrase/topoisomerase IV subunit B